MVGKEEESKKKPATAIDGTNLEVVSMQIQQVVVGLKGGGERRRRWWGGGMEVV